MTDAEGRGAATVPGVILAGGASRRFALAAPEGKAFADLGGKSLLNHVLDRLRPQVGRVWLSLSPGAEAPAVPDVLPLRDDAPSLRGPLAGLSVALDRLAQEGGDWLVLAPCDTPFLPADLVSRLLGAREPGVLAMVAADGDRLHPACSAWHVDTAATVSKALADPAGPGLMALLERLPHGVVRWPDGRPPPFFNVNTPDELDAATAWLERVPC